MLTHPAKQSIEIWPIERLVEYPRKPRKNDAAVDHMCASIREFGFKTPCLVRSDGDGDVALIKKSVAGTERL
jgi:ParB-like chromosome segregation protein Spo0J